MTDTLIKVDFCEDLRKLMLDFECGVEVWDKDVSDWIKGAGKHDAINCIANPNRPCQVWVHLTSGSNEIIGFSSLAPSAWDGYPKLPIIPNLAIATPHQGNGFLRPIMQHLVYEAIVLCNANASMTRALALYVHPGNQDAIVRYRHYGFRSWPQRHTLSGITYEGMLKNISGFSRDVHGYWLADSSDPPPQIASTKSTS